MDLGILTRVSLFMTQGRWPKIVAAEHASEEPLVLGSLMVQMMLTQMQHLHLALPLVPL